VILNSSERRSNRSRPLTTTYYLVNTISETGKERGTFETKIDMNTYENINQIYDSLG